MTKNSKGGKGAKKGKNSGPSSKTRPLILPSDDLVLGIVEKALGDRRFQVHCFSQGKFELRLCHARGAIRRNERIDKGSTVLVSPREYEVGGRERGDIVHLYNGDETRSLRAQGFLPEVLPGQEADSGEGGIVFDAGATVPEDEEESPAPQPDIDLDDL